MKTVDVAIIGGGILGLSSGYWLAKQGLRVTVFEKGRIAWEASGRATGFQSLRGENPPEIALAAEANRLWLTLDEELGYPTEWLAGGRLWVELDEPAFQDLQKTCGHWQTAGLPVRLVDAAEARTLAPCLSERVLGGMHTARGGHANPQRATQAFGWAFQDRGGEVLEQTPVLAITSANGKITGVRTPAGTISAGFVVNCAGPQIALLSRPLGIEIPIVAARLEGCVTTPLPRQFDVALVGNGLSVRQTRRGNIHFNGGPHEWVAVDLTGEPAKPNTPVARGAARRLAELFPVLANTPLLRTWAGVVEVTPDHATIIERASAPDGLILVTASGHGFGLAPAIGKSICELVVDGRSSVPVDDLSLRRFAGLAPDWAHSRRWIAGAYNT